MSPQAEHDVNGVTGDWNQFKKQLAAALLCAVYSFIVAFALMKGLMVAICVEIKIYGAFTRRLLMGDAGSSPLDARDTLVDFHAGRHGRRPGRRDGPQRFRLFHARHARAQFC
jgi:hypothetical protein